MALSWALAVLDLEEDVVSNVFKFADDTKLLSQVRECGWKQWECRRIWIG